MALKISQLKEKLGEDNFKKYFSDIDDNDLEQKGISESIDLNAHKQDIIYALTNEKNTKLSPLRILQAADEGTLQEFNAINNKSVFSKISSQVLIEMNSKEREIVKPINPTSDKKIEPKAFNMILIRANSIPEEPELEGPEKETIKAAKQGLGDCVNVMVKNDIPLTQRFGRNKLGRLLQCTDEELAAAGSLLSYLDQEKALADNKILAKNTFDYLAENKFSMAKASGFIDSFRAMKELGIPIRGNRQALMERFKSVKELEEFNTVLQEIKGKGTNNIDQKEFDVLLQAKNLAGKGPALGQCIKAMKDNKDKIRFRGIDVQFDLERMTKMTKSQLDGMGKVLESLNKQPNGRDKSSYLDQSTFNYVLDHPKTMETKGQQIADAFHSLRSQGIPLEGLRQPIMAIKKPEDIEKLTKAVQSLSGAQLDKDEIKGLIKHIPKLAANADASILGKSMKAVKEAGLSLATTNPLGTDRIEKLVNLNAEQSRAVETILTSLASSKALGNSSLDFINGDPFDYLTAHAQELSEEIPGETNTNGQPLIKADRVAEVFSKMHEAGIAVVGHRRPIMVMNNEELKNLSAVLSSMSNPKLTPPLNKKEFNVLSEQAVKIKDEEQGKLLGKCIRELRKPENELALTSLKPFTEGRLSQLLNVPANELPAVEKILTSLSGKLGGNLSDRQGDIFDYLMNDKNRASLNEKLDPEDTNYPTKADLLSKVFKQMADASLEIRGNRRKLLNMAPAQLQNLSSILGPLSPNQLAKPLSQKEFKALIAEAENFEKADPERGTNLGKCIKAMQENDIALTTLRPGVKNNLTLLAGLEPVEELTAVTKILETLAGTSPSSLGASKTDLFNNDSFNYLMEHASELKEPVEGQEPPQTKADLIASVFQSMNAAKIAIPGHRQQVMNMKPQELKNMAAVLASMKSMQQPFNKKEFNALAKSLGEHNENLSEDYCNSLGECIKQMRKPENDLSLTSLKPFTEGRLSQLAKVPAQELPAVKKILTSLSGKLDGNLSDRQGDIFDYLMNNNNRAKLNQKLDPDNPDSSTKADVLVDVFKKMGEAKIEITGNRRKLLNMEPVELQNLAAILEPLGPNQLAKPLSQNEFKALIKHAENFQSANPERGENLGKCIKAMQNNNIPLTTVLPGIDSNLTRLAKLDPVAELPAVTELLTNLAGESSRKKPSFLEGTILDIKNGNTFDYIVNNAQELAPKTELIAAIFDEMREAGIPIIGHRRPIMKMNEEELKALHETMKGLNIDKKHPLSRESFSALRDQMPVITNLWADPEEGKVFSSCLANLKKNDIGFTKLFQPVRGDDKVAKLAKLDKNQLKAAATVLDSLGSKKGKLLDSDTFENIVKRAEDLAQPVGPEGKTKADYVAEAYNLLEAKGKPIVGSRQSIMDLNHKQLQAFTKTVQTAGAGQFNSKAQVKSLVEEFKKNYNSTEQSSQEIAKQQAARTLAK